jgi:hypothetical protein
MNSRDKKELYNRKTDEEYTDPSVIEAAQAYRNKDAKTYQQMRKELIDKGYDISIVDSAINSYIKELAKAEAPTPEEWIKAYKTGNKSIWQPIFQKMKAAGWSQKDLLDLVK